MSSRKIVGVDIIERRLAVRRSNNVWNYVTDINQSLSNDDIDEENMSITIHYNFTLTDGIYTQLKDLYVAAGWKVDISFNGSITELKFTDEQS